MKVGKDGNVILMAMLALAGVAGITYTVTMLHRISDKQAHTVRAKALMGVMENMIRLTVSQPGSYTGCNSGTGSASCSLTASVLSNIAFSPVPGIRCASGTPHSSCGIVLENPLFDPANRSFTGTLHYNGIETALADIALNIAIPEEVLQSKTYDCSAQDPTRPLFAGFNSSGQTVCLGFTPNPCPAGQYISKLNPQSLQPTCTSFTTTITCPNAFLGKFAWLGGTNFASSCTPLLDPFTVWGQ